MKDHEFLLLFSEACAGRQFEELAGSLTSVYWTGDRSDHFRSARDEILREADRIRNGGKIAPTIGWRDCFAKLTQDLRLDREEVDRLRQLVFNDM